MILFSLGSGTLWPSSVYNKLNGDDSQPGAATTPPHVGAVNPPLDGAVYPPLDGAVYPPHDGAVDAI